MHNPMNRNPEENRPLDPFAAAEAPETASKTTYPVEADGEIHELTLDELIEAAAQGLSRHNAYVRRNRAANALPNGQIYAAFVEEYPDVRPEDIPQQVWEWAQQEGSLVGNRGAARRARRARDEPPQPPRCGRHRADRRRTGWHRPGNARPARQITRR